MIIQCPNCGEKVVVNGLGRKPLNIPLKNVYECLKKHRDVATAVQELGCSPGYIFTVVLLDLKATLKASFRGYSIPRPTPLDSTVLCGYLPR